MYIGCRVICPWCLQSGYRENSVCHARNCYW